MNDLVVMPSCSHLTAPVTGRLGPGWRVTEAEVEVFPDGEQLVRVPLAADARRVAVLGTMAPPQPESLLAMCEAADAVCRAGAEEVHGMVPYLAYSRQDRVTRPGEAVTGALVLDLLERSGFASISTIDTHNERLFDDAPIPVRNLYPLEASAAAVRGAAGHGDVVIVAPDAGAYERSALVARELDAPLLRCVKSKAAGTTEIELPPDAGRALGGDRTRIVVVDDVTSSGSTVFPLLAELEACAERRLELLYVVTHVTSADHPLLVRSPSNIHLLHSDTVLAASASFSVAGLVAGDLAAWSRAPGRRRHAGL